MDQYFHWSAKDKHTKQLNPQPSQRSDSVIDPNLCDLLIVDDDPKITASLERLLIDSYAIHTLNDSTLVTQTAERLLPKIILLDIQMPIKSGIEVCRALKANPITEDIPVIFITALYNSEILREAFDAGATDYITKPFISVEVELRVRNHMLIHHLHQAQKSEITELISLTDIATQNLMRSQMATIVSISKMMELRDSYTGGHIYRIQHGCRLLAQLCFNEGLFKDEITPAFIHDIFYASALHDIGKLSIPDQILLKEGKLTEEEFNLMKSHTNLGADSLVEIDELYPGNDFIRLGIEITRFHHERWDGTGYPNRVVEHQIPLSARIMALVDVYDALRSVRSYKPAWTHEACKVSILEDAGSHFDPVLVDVFIKHDGEFDALHHVLTSDQPHMIAMY